MGPTYSGRVLASLLGLLILGPAAAAARADDPWGAWPAAADPARIGRAVAENLLHRPDNTPTSASATAPSPATTTASRPRRRTMGYPEVCTAYGSLRFAGAVKDKELLDGLVAKYAVLLTDAGKRRVPTPNHVDRSVFGILPMELYRQTGDERFLTLGKQSADAQWADATPDGLSSQTRFWIDDMFMIIGLQTQAFRVTKDPTYLDRAATEMSAYIDALQQPDGLFWHGKNARIVWGRGNGWMAVGMAELLAELPADHPRHDKILAAFRRMMDALVKFQAADGSWRQVIDDEKSWTESSCTGMFTFSLARGLRRGWLDGAAYKDAARKGWLAFAGDVDEDGNVRDVCVGTNQSDVESYYLARDRKSGDLHGQAAAAWAAWAMLQ